MNYFKIARLKLTLWYLLILFCLLSISSLAAIESERRAFNTIQDALSNKQERPKLTTLLETRLNQFESRFIVRLVVLDLFLFVIGALGSYYLSGITLKSIEQMLDAQEQFASNASHQLRTPLTIINMEIEAVTRTQKQIPKAYQSLFITIKDEVMRMSTIVSQLLQDVRIPTTHKQTFDTISLTNIVVSTTTKMQAIATEKQINMTTQITPHLLVKGDPTQLEEVVRILIDNALKYTPHLGQVTISLLSHNKERVRLEVKDTGPGIAPTDIPFLFKRYFRSQQTENIPGNGLGLSIAQTIIKSHNGSIKVKSDVGQGSTFTVILPIVS